MLLFRLRSLVEGSRQLRRRITTSFIRIMILYRFRMIKLSPGVKRRQRRITVGGDGILAEMFFLKGERFFFAFFVSILFQFCFHLSHYRDENKPKTTQQQDFRSTRGGGPMRRGPSANFGRGRNNFSQPQYNSRTPPMHDEYSQSPQETTDNFEPHNQEA